MDTDIFGFTPLNLALSGSIDDLLELYANIEKTYAQVIDEYPCFPLNLPTGRKHINRIAKSRISSDFNRVLGGCLEIFGVSDFIIVIHERHLKYFDFFDEKRIHNIDFEIRINQEWANKGYSWVDKKYLSDVNKLYSLQDTMIRFDAFLDYFRRAVMRCIHEERQNTDPAYTIFQARKDVDSSISTYMKRIRHESTVYLDNIDLTDAPLYLYDALNSISCKRCNHIIMPVKFYARHMDGKNAVALPVHHCKNCGKYLCGKMSFSLFKIHFGRIKIETRELTPGGNQVWNIQGESMLHQLGYNVVAGEMSTSERRNLLVSILESKQLTFFEIVATIEQDIRIFETNYRMQNAVKKWKEDLLYINEYMVQRL